jgi:peptidyl-prolyl cis-trans isomerase SurA
VISFQKIFIPTSDPENPLATPETQLALSESIAAKLGAGEDFSALAKTYSKDAFAEDGGLQQNVPRLDLSPEFASIILPTKIEFGPSPPLDDQTRAMVEQRVSKKKTSAQYERWIESKRKRAIIDIKDN